MGSGAGTILLYFQLYKLPGPEPMGVLEHPKHPPGYATASEDQLRYVFDSVIKAAENAEPTKRSIVSAIGRFYDPMGFLSPIVIKFKVFMQALCKAKIGWDEVVPELLRMRWQALVTDLRKATVVTIPRSYLSGIDENTLSFSLCGYCDASLAAYAAVVYLQIETKSGSYKIMRFVASKTRVSPLKKQSIPRLELLSALLHCTDDVQE